ESENRFLEGTGSLIFDYQNKVVYANLSPRTDAGLLQQLGEKLGYEVMAFTSVDRAGKDIYHTNVMMCLAERYAIVALESLPKLDERQLLVEKLETTGHEIIPISYEQMEHFAGNMLELRGAAGQSLLAMSRAAYDSLALDQLKVIAAHSQVVPLSVPTIERYGGGSVRCMLSGVHLPKA
ncbi:MAG: amidinotransferase, partial [Cytophagales bacterium]|nr:amidinotransferase [Cytophagales bacterium]